MESAWRIRRGAAVGGGTGDGPGGYRCDTPGASHLARF